MIKNIQRSSAKLYTKWRTSYRNNNQQNNSRRASSERITSEDDEHSRSSRCFPGGHLNLPPYCERVTNHRRNQSTPLTILLAAFCVILSIFVIAPYLQEAFGGSDDGGKGKERVSSNAAAKDSQPSHSPSISFVPTTSNRPSVSMAPSLVPSVSFAPTISDVPSYVPTEPVPSAAPSDHFATTTFAFFFINATFPMNATTIANKEDEIFESFDGPDVFGNYSFITMRHVDINEEEQYEYTDTDTDDDEDTTRTGTIAITRCSAFTPSNLTNYEFNCMIRSAYNVTCDNPPRDFEGCIYIECLTKDGDVV